MPRADTNKTSSADLASRSATESGERQLGVGDIVDLRYRVKRLIGRGGMGAVYLVEDLQEEGYLALKQIYKNRTDPRSVSILKNEFLALAPLVHPNLARVYNFGHDWRTNEYYFTSDFVNGTQLYKATHGLNLRKEEDLHRLLNLMVQILRALEFIHARGLVHGDLKPENLLVAAKASNGGRPEEYVKVIDFGLTKREKDFGGKKIFGTSFYIAPETVLGSQVDRRTDLYSIGVVFYHVVSRTLPFLGRTNLEVLKGHLEDTPKPPNSVTRDVPDGLSSIIVRLMEKKPSDRFSCASEVIQEINKTFSTQFPLETPESACSYLLSSRYIGRSRELRELNAFFHSEFRVSSISAEEELNLCFLQTKANLKGFDDVPPPPAGHLFLVRGERGIGKSSLIQNFRRYVEVHGVAFLEPKIKPDRAAQNHNLRSFLEAISRLFSGNEKTQQSTLLSLISLFQRGEIPVEGSQKVSLEGLAKGLVEACKKVPLVLSFVDLHHAEEALLKFIRVLVKRILMDERSESKILLLAAARDEELESASIRRLLLSPELRSHFREIALERLSQKEMQAMLESMFGRRQFQPIFFKRLYEESDGNPGVVHQILQYFIQQKRLRRTLTGWTYDGDIERESIPGEVRRELRNRIGRLSPDAKQLGLAFAFLGNSCELEVAARLVGIQPGKILSALLDLTRARILREDGEGATDRFSFSHQSSRELFLNLVPEKQKETMNLRAGLLLEERMNAGVEVDPRRLAFHFLRAGDTRSGVRYGLMTARKYAESLQPAKALELYREVRELCRNKVSHISHDLDYQIATLEATVGNNQIAATILTRLLNEDVHQEVQGSKRVARTDILVELGIIESRLGNLRRSAGYFQQAYRSLKDQGMSPSLARLLFGFANLFYYSANFIESLRYCERVQASDELLPDDLSRAALYLLAAENHFRMDNSEEALNCCRKSLVLLDNKKDVGSIAFNILNLAKYSLYRGRLEKAQKQFELCARVYQSIGMRELEAECIRESGGIFLVLGSLTKGKEELAKAQEIYEATGHLWNHVETLKLLGETHCLMGRYEEAESFLEDAEELNVRLGNPKKRWEIRLTTARILIDRGHFADAEKHLEAVSNAEELGQFGNEETRLVQLELGCRLALYAGDFRKAMDLTARGMISAREIQHKMSVFPLLGLRLQLYLALGKHSSVERILKELDSISRRYNLPLLSARTRVFEGSSLLCDPTKEGNCDRACRRFEKALEVFRDLQNERELAELYLLYGLAMLHKRNFERSYLLLEEGAYLAKKLNLAHLRCRYLMAMGKLETMLQEGAPSQGRGHYVNAENLARRFNLQEILWKILFEISKLLAEEGKPQAAIKPLLEAVEIVKKVQSKIPRAFHQSYLEASGAADLNVLHERLCQAAEKVEG